MTTRHYVVPVDQTRWAVPGESSTVFSFDYDEGRDRLLSLYEKGKEKQWNTNTRLDWSIDVDPESPENFPDFYIPIYGSDTWESMDEKGHAQLRHHMSSWMNSQFLHGEQGALVCTAKIVETVPDVDCKFYAATQVMDEARHMETYSRYLREKVELAYPINPNLKSLLNDIVADGRWDMTCLGMQIMVEGLALAAFAMVRDFSDEPLAKALNAYVMQDEARHVAFGRLSLRDYYPQLTQAERDEREEFIVYASYLMRDRFRGDEVWEYLDLPYQECIEYVEQSQMLGEFRKMLFSRIVPTVKDLGLFGEKVQKAFVDMGVIDYADVNPDDLSAADEQIADEMEQRNALTGSRNGHAGNGQQESGRAQNNLVESGRADNGHAGLTDVDPERAAEVSATVEAGREG